MSKLLSCSAAFVPPPLTEAGDEKHAILKLGLQSSHTRNWLCIDGDLSTFYQHKQDYLAKPECLIVLPGSEAAQREFHGFLLGHLLAQHSASYRLSDKTLNCQLSRDTANQTESSFSPLIWNTDCEDESALANAGAWIAEDVCLLELRRSKYVLSAASVCSPSNWRLHEKIGCSVADIHQPVPGYVNVLENKVERLLRKLRPGKLLLRHNWSIQESNELYWINDFPQAFELETAYWRVERQSLLRLPKTGAIVFGIRLFLHPMTTMLQLPTFKLWFELLLKKIHGDRHDRKLWRYKNLLHLAEENAHGR